MTKHNIKFIAMLAVFAGQTTQGSRQTCLICARAKFHQVFLEHLVSPCRTGAMSIEDQSHTANLEWIRHFNFN